MFGSRFCFILLRGIYAVFQQVILKKPLQGAVTVLLCLIVSVTAGRETLSPMVRCGDIKFCKNTPVQFYQYNSLRESRTRFTSSRKALSRSVCL